MRKIIASTIVALAVLAAGAGVAGAAQIGWVLAASGSIQCNVVDGTNNHVQCWSYPPGGGAPTLVKDEWLPYACLGGAYMIAGNNAGTPAQLVYQNVGGHYCSSAGSGTTFRVGTCWNGANWLEGTRWRISATRIEDNGVHYPFTTLGGINFPNSWACSYGSGVDKVTSRMHF